MCLNSRVFCLLPDVNNGTNDLLSQMGNLASDSLTQPLFGSSSVGAAPGDSADLYNMPDPLFVLSDLNDVPDTFNQLTGSLTSAVAPPVETPATNMAPYTQTSSSEYTPSEYSGFGTQNSSPLASPSSSATNTFSPQSATGTSHLYTSTSSFIEQLMDNDDAFEEMDFSDGSIDEGWCNHQTIYRIDMAELTSAILSIIRQ